MRELVGLIAVFAWVAGIVLAKTVWLAFGALFFPLYAWYLFVELIFQLTGGVAS